MKNFLLFFLSLMACITPMSSAKPYEFKILGFFPETGAETIVLTSSEQMEEFIEAIVTQQKATDPSMLPHLPQFESNLRELYAPYDEQFFASNNLILALLERGSGSLRFCLKELFVEGDTLNIVVEKISPMIQTMDYRTHAMALSVCKKTFGVPYAKVTVLPQA